MYFVLSLCIVNRVCFWRNLHRWQKFYTPAGSDGSDKFHLCITILMIITTTELDLVQVGLTILGSRVTLAVDNLRQASSRFGVLSMIMIFLSS